MNQLLFNLAEGERRKKEGMDIAKINRADILRKARHIAWQIAKTERTVTADDIYRWLTPEAAEVLGPAAGSIFRGKEWEWTGRFVKSRRASNHARMIREWKLK